MPYSTYTKKPMIILKKIFTVPPEKAVFDGSDEDFKFDIDGNNNQTMVSRDLVYYCKNANPMPTIKITLGK